MDKTHLKCTYVTLGCTLVYFSLCWLSIILFPKVSSKHVGEKAYYGESLLYSNPGRGETAI